MQRLTDRPVLVAIAGALTIAFSAILVRLSHATPSTAAVFRCAYALPLLGLLAAREGRRYGPRSAHDRRLALIAGAFFAVDLICWHHAIGDVGAGLATVLGNCQVVLVGVLAWLFLSERPNSRTIAAVPVVLLGVVLISGVIGHGTYGRDPARGVMFGILTGLTYAVFILVLRQGNSDLRRPAGPLFEATAAATVFAVAGGLIVGDLHVQPTWPGHGWLATLALTSQVLGWLLISVSLPRLPAAKTSVLLTIQPVGSVLLGIAIFSESPSAVQFAGVAVVLGGVMLANLRPRRTAAAA
ncbi:MAG TPA: DMT family transporter [Thermoleophilaceae bacterium]|nr:DMT family transporter [Thermoleophilaceae bacterium]